MAAKMAGDKLPNGRWGPGNKAGRKFPEGHTLSVGNRGGRVRDEVKAALREGGLGALPRIRAIAEDPKHRDYYKANIWLAERGLRDEIESSEETFPLNAVNIPPWKPHSDH